MFITNKVQKQIIELNQKLTDKVTLVRRIMVFGGRF
jgi:hypothetical protein